MRPLVAAVSGMSVGRSPFPLQAVDLAAVVDAPGEAKAAAAFFLTVVFGGAVIYRYGGRLDRAVDASTASPLVSMVYGMVAYGVVLFATGYLFSRVASLGLGSSALWLAFAVAFATGVMAMCGLGFVVVGAWLTGAVGSRDPWLGLVGVGAVTALAWLLLPVVLAAAVWFGIAALGIGGPTRRWIHKDVGQEPR